MLDVRELYDEFEELKSDYEMYESDTEESMPVSDYQRFKDIEALDKEIDLLYCRQNGINLIDEDDFPEHIKSEMTEVYELSGPYYPYIDWKEWADYERQNYDEVTFDGNVYLYKVV